MPGFQHYVFVHPYPFPQLLRITNGYGKNRTRSCLNG